MNKEQNQKNESLVAIKCECGKTLAFRTENGEIIIKCRACKRHRAIKTK